MPLLQSELVAVLNCPTIPSGATVHRTVLDQVGLFDTRVKYSADMEYFPRIVARFPLLVVESPRIVEYRIHGANYQLQTWRERDFYDQLEALHRTVISYADIQHEEVKRSILEQRMVGNLFHMLKMADRFGDRALVRQAGKYLQRFRCHLSARQKVQTYIAARTGVCPHLHRVKRAEVVLNR